MRKFIIAAVAGTAALTAASAANAQWCQWFYNGWAFSYICY
jgi:hypothetical protein